MRPMVPPTYSPAALAAAAQHNTMVIGSGSGFELLSLSEELMRANQSVLDCVDRAGNYRVVELRLQTRTLNVERLRRFITTHAAKNPTRCCAVLDRLQGADPGVRFAGPGGFAGLLQDG